MEKHIHKDLLPAFKRLSPMIFTEARLPLIRGINQKLIRPIRMNHYSLQNIILHMQIVTSL